MDDGELIADERRTDWSYAGAPSINEARTKCGSTIDAYSGSPSTITTQISGCSDDQYVLLGCGTFNLSAALELTKDNVTLRGSLSGGALCTTLNFTGTNGNCWPYQGGDEAAFTVCGTLGGLADATPTVFGASGSSAALTGTDGDAGVFAKGATVLNLGSSLSWGVGDVGVLTESNYSAASLPRAGFFVSDKNQSSGTAGICWQGAFEDFGAALEQRFIVTAVNGNDVTISPPLAHGLWNSGNSPRVYRYANGVYASGIGVEYLKVNTTSAGLLHAVVGVLRVKDSWFRGVVLIPDPAAGGDYAISFLDSLQVTYRDSWQEQFTGGGHFTTTSYGVNTQGSQFVLVENNIFNGGEAPIVINIATMGSVFAYNYENHTSGEGGLGHHQPGIVYNLIEGNTVLKFAADLFHGNSMLETPFRNYAFDRGFDLQSYHRFWNLIGNVLTANETRKTTSSDGMLYDRFDSIAFRLGYNTQAASIDEDYNQPDFGGVAHDPDVATTTFIWGNYDTFTDSAVFDEDEVPDSDATFPNPVPGSQVLPDSLYLDAKPQFFTATGVTWPPIGPDVTGGSLVAGHVYKLPAQVVFEAAGGDPANFDPTDYN